VNAPAVSVVVCTYTEERWDDLVAAVASVRGQSPFKSCESARSARSFPPVWQRGQ